MKNLLENYWNKRLYNAQYRKNKKQLKKLLKKKHPTIREQEYIGYLEQVIERHETKLIDNENTRANQT